MKREYQYDRAVFIGKLLPFHDGHKHIVDIALDKAERVTILLGDCGRPRDSKMMWTGHEREEMIRLCYSQDENDRIEVLTVEDLFDDMNWCIEVMSKVNRLPNEKIALIGHKKDNSSYYLDMFPQWDSIEVPNYRNINGTDIRTALLEDWDSLSEQPLPRAVAEFIDATYVSGKLKRPFDEWNIIKSQDENWWKPIKPVFMTVDSVVIKSGHALLIERKSDLGAGLLALSGGFMEQHGSVDDNCIRELKEETGIKESDQYLKNHIVARWIAEDPYRSRRGRTISHVILIDLGFGKLPKVTAGSDAKNAWWIPVHELKEEDFFEDHYRILNKMRGLR